MTISEEALVAIVIPNYNHGRYLCRALQSVLDQTYSNWELIVVDNNSTDETDEIISKFVDPRIRYLKINNNGIIAASRNLGLNSSRGQYVAFLDADDWWERDKLAACVTILEGGGDVVYHELEVISEDKNMGRKRLIGSWQVRSPAQINLLLRGNAIATSSVVVRRDILAELGGFDENPGMVACEDYNLWLKIAGVTEKFVFCPDVLGFYLDHDGGSSNRDMSSPAMCAMEPFMRQLTQSERRYVEAKVNYLRLRFAYLNGDYSLAAQCASGSITNGPVSIRIRALFMYLVSMVRPVKRISSK